MPLPLQALALVLACLLARREAAVIAYLRAEVSVLRERLAAHGERRVRLSDDQRRRLARKGQPLGRAGLASVASLVTPDTILRWYRQLVARRYDGSRSRGPARAPRRTRAQLEALVCDVARENGRYGYTRIRDTLRHLGHDLSRTTVARLLRRNGLEPAPTRGSETTWSEFLSTHAATLCAGDFLSVDVLTALGVVRYQVFVLMHLATRRVHLAGIVRDTQACERWLLQIGRNLTDAVDGFLTARTHLVLDRDPLYTKRFRDLLRNAGVQVVRLPARSPNLNAHVERWVRSCREECLDRVVIFGEGHLRRLVAGYVAHFNHERPHQGLRGELGDPDPRAAHRSGRIVRRDRLGGLLRFYHRASA